MAPTTRSVHPAMAPHALPEPTDITAACCDRWADGARRLALLHPCADGSAERIGFDALRSASLRVAQALAARGIGRGARVAILLPQGPEALVALFAADRLGAIAVPLGHGGGNAVLAARLNASRASVLVTDASGLAELEPLLQPPPALRHVFCTDGGRGGALGFWTEAQQATPLAASRAGGPGAAALLLHGADALGHERGMLHAARSVLAQAEGFLARFGPIGEGAAPVWTTLPWGRCGGLLDVVLPALALGVPVLAQEMAVFDPARAVEIIARHGVGAVLLPPEALYALREAGATLPPGHRLARIVTQGGALAPDLRAWVERAFGVPVVDSLARPECGVILIAAEGAVGRPPPGREVGVLGAGGGPLPAGQPGRIALRRPDPGLFLGLWGQPPAAQAGWFATDATGTLRPDGGIAMPLPDGDATRPGTLEACLRAHPAVAAAALLHAEAEDGPGTAIIVPRSEAQPGTGLAAELRDFLRARFPERHCPRRIAFARDLPEQRNGRPLAALLEGTQGLGAGPQG